jgi:hypothetical protein
MTDLVVVGHLRALVPGQRQPDDVGQRGQQRGETASGRFRAVVGGQVDQAQVTAGPVDEGGDG